jgi:hypothetical protein
VHDSCTILLRQGLAKRLLLWGFPFLHG